MDSRAESVGNHFHWAHYRVQLEPFKPDLDVISSHYQH